MVKYKKSMSGGKSETGIFHSQSSHTDVTLAINYWYTPADKECDHP